MYARELKLPLGEQSCFLFRPRQTGKTTLLALLADAKPRLRSFREDHPGGRLVCVGEIDRPFKLGNIECLPWRRGCLPATPNHPGLSTEAPWAKPPRRNVDCLPTDSAEDAFLLTGLPRPGGLPGGILSGRCLERFDPRPHDGQPLLVDDIRRQLGHLPGATSGDAREEHRSRRIAGCDDASVWQAKRVVHRLFIDQPLFEKVAFAEGRAIEQVEHRVASARRLVTR